MCSFSAVQEERGPRKATKPTKDVGGTTVGTSSSPRIRPNSQDISLIEKETAGFERRIQQVCAQLRKFDCIAAEYSSVLNKRHVMLISFLKNGPPYFPY